MNIISPKLVNDVIKTKNKGLSHTQSPSQTVNFKGSPSSLITAADQKILNVFSQHYGNVGERLVQKVDKLVTSSDILKKSSRISIEKGALSIREKGVGQALIENIIFPFVNLPLYTASWVLKKAQSIPALKDGARKIYNVPLFRIPRKLNELDQKTDMLKGMFEKTQDVIAKFAKEKGVSKEYLIEQLNKVDDTPEAKQLVQEANEYIKESLYKVSNKFFDKHTGNYNTAFERPLNRIVTGLIPVAFLANDAYNLSVLCGDDKEVSKKEASERRKQEISRVFTTAYLQLLTFGAFTKQVNTIPWFTPLTSAATVLFSETTSRKRLGKPILFLSKEKAKEYNKRDKEKDSKVKTDKQQVLSEKSKVEPKYSTTAMTSTSTIDEKLKPSVFASFKGSVEKPKEEKERKALINIDTFKKGVAILITGGFALSFLKNSSYTKNTKVMRLIKDFGNFCKQKIYNPLAFKDFEISQSEFDKVAKNLKDVGCKEIIEGHEFIKNKYGKMAADNVIKMYKGTLSKSSYGDVATEAVDKLKQNGSSLSDSELGKVAESIKTALGLEATSIAEFKYSNVTKKAAEIINNKKLNLTEQEISLLKETMQGSISQRVKEVPIQVETKLKPFVDMVTQPFKFIMSAAKLPFKLTTTVINLVTSPVEKKVLEASLGKAELNKFEQTIHKVLTQIYGEKSPKVGKTSQVIFANAMEQLQKRTYPYRKAEEALRNAQISGSDAEIAKAKEALAKAKNKLIIYVNSAVEKSFNGVTQSSNKNVDLAMMSKLSSSAVTSAFLVADNYNMVMLKSDGEDKEGAKEVANERIVQRLSGLFYQTLLINWFNSTFRAQYNSSLKGMTAVTVPYSITTEIVTRKSIGMPVRRKSFEELQANEEKNENREGFLGKYFKFMRLLTGKKSLKGRMPKNSEAPKQPNNAENNQPTNLLERFTK